MDYNLKTNDGVTRLAEDYATFYLIKKYLDTKEPNVLKELKTMLYKSIEKRTGKVFPKDVSNISDSNINTPESKKIENIENTIKTEEKINGDNLKENKEISKGYIRHRITF